MNGKGQALVTAAGPRAAQEELFSHLGGFLKLLPRHPELLARPVRVVVPSASLRQHLLEVLCERCGGGVAGIKVQTLFGLAQEVLKRAGFGSGYVGDALLPVMVERFARREPVLTAALGAFEQAYGCLTAAVRDLLDAGMEPAHVEGLVERLAELGGEEAERGAAVLRVAAKVALALAHEGVQRPSQLMARAGEVLRHQPALLPAQQLLVYGFADATALAADLLEELVRIGATVVLDLPPHPADPRRCDPGEAFTTHLRQRLGGGEKCRAAVSSSIPAKMEGFVADDAEGEAREVALRIRGLLDRHVLPERIAVVARDPLPYRDSLTRHLARWGVPWSSLGVPGPWVPWARRVRSAVALLSSAGDASLATWLDAQEGVNPPLAVGLAALGVRCLREVAHLDVGAVLRGREALPLPLVGGGEEEEGGVRRQTVSASELQRAHHHAQRAEQLLARWVEPATLAEHQEQLWHLTEALQWSPHGRATSAWQQLLTRVMDSVPSATLLWRRELGLLLEGAAEEVLRHPAGGGGAGVTVASVMAVRGFRFEHLFLLGCNRGVFPRRGMQDPLLPDRVRTALLSLLPDLPRKGDPADEERYLFAQLCASSSHVTVSWRRFGDDNAPLPPSPLLAGLEIPVEEVGRVKKDGDPIPLLEAACAAGLAGDRRTLAAMWSGARPGGEAELGRWRMAVLDEQDPLRDTAEGKARWGELGPYLGFVGRAPWQEQALSVSFLEALARCPWQTFLTRVLHVEPPLDQEGRLPELGAAALGTAVHRALARLLAEGRRHGPGGVSPPSEEEMTHSAHWAVLEVAKEEGVPPELAAVMGARVKALLQVARELLWPGAGELLPVRGVEEKGVFRWRVAGEVWEVNYRADLAEAVGNEVRLTDFKTGVTPFNKPNSSAAASLYLKGVHRGERLQAAVYAAASGGTGRFLFLAPEQDPERSRVVEVDSEAATVAVERALAVLIPLWAQGVMFPRLEGAKDRKEPHTCQLCTVREACWRGDSGVRARLAGWVLRTKADPAFPMAAAAAALVRGWCLGLEGEE